MWKAKLGGLGTHAMGAMGMAWRGEDLHVRFLDFLLNVEGSKGIKPVAIHSNVYRYFRNLLGLLNAE